MKKREIKKLLRSRCQSRELPPESEMRAFAACGEEEARPVRRMSAKKPLLVIAAAVVAICMLCSVAYAAVPSFRQFINLKIFYSEEEAIKVYTASDLNAVRNDMTANYRLMNDIVFTAADFAQGGEFEGGFTPIGNSETPFCGVFDGGGHTVYGINIACAEDTGLFGRVTTTNESLSGKGVIMNLRLADGRICFSSSDENGASYAAADRTVGAICGLGNYVVRCSVEDFVIECTGAGAVGGIAGCANIIDSCYSNVSPVSNAEYVGSVAGYARACVTCYSEGQGTLCGKYSSVPVILTQENFDAICERLTGRELKQFESFYRAYDLSESFFGSGSRASALNRYYSEYCAVSPSTLSGTVYIFEPLVSFGENDRLDSIVGKSFSEEEIGTVVFGGNMKHGNLFSYSASDGERSFEGFDFENTWYMQDGKPRLSVFAENNA